MTGAERPPPEPLLLSEASPVALGGEISGDALDSSFALFFGIGASLPYFRGDEFWIRSGSLICMDCWAWGIPAVLSWGIPGYAL